MKKLSFISLFTGAGGLDYGLERAGFKLIGAFESDDWCVKTLRRNRRGPIFQSPISRTTNVLQLTGAQKMEMDLLAGGPPCQPFSHAASWATGAPNGLDDARAHSITHFVRIIEQVLPKAILLENVPGFTFGDPSALAYTIKRLKQTNSRYGTKYNPSFQIIDAADYGVPQHRRRLFLIAFRDGTAFEFPTATHGPKANSGQTKYVTAWDAIQDIKIDSSEDLTIRGRWADLLPSIPEGNNYLWHTNRGNGLPLFGWRTKYWSFLLKLAKARPSWTIPASPSQNAGPFHWENRLLSTQEMLRLQTFPDDTILCGDRAARQRQIGNAVPSLVGEVLGRAIFSQLSTRNGKETPPTLSISIARTTPRATRRQIVPMKYLCLKGYHNPHPGTGRGPRARRQKRKKR